MIVDENEPCCCHFYVCTKPCVPREQGNTGSFDLAKEFGATDDEACQIEVRLERLAGGKPQIVVNNDMTALQSARGGK